MRLGLLHPGEMGVSVGQSLLDSGHEVCWLSAGRSQQTVSRAVNFQPFADLDSLLEHVDGVISVCPPSAAVSQAQAVSDIGFDGIYVDGNAVSPSTAGRISEIIGAQYVDGGIVGPPALQAGSTRLYLSGSRASEVAAWFSSGALQAITLTSEKAGDSTAASSLKMAYAAYTKGSSALLLAVNALAEKAGVSEALHAEWAISQPALSQRSELTAKGTSPKAWRFVGEMHEIATTFAELGLPDGFHKGAAEIYQRMAPLKDLPAVELAQVLEQILSPDNLTKTLPK